jgi:hypothetical protein
MAQYLCAERPTQILAQEPAPERGGHALPMPARPAPSRNEPGRGGHGLPAAGNDAPRSTRDPIRAGRDALLASLDRPLGQSPGRGLEPAAHSGDQPRRPVSGGAAALLGGAGSAFDDDADLPKEVPAVPSLAVLRPRRTVGQGAGGSGGQAAVAESSDAGSKPRKRLPSWDDVLFGGGPAARESS